MRPSLTKKFKKLKETAISADHYNRDLSIYYKQDKEGSFLESKTQLIEIITNICQLNFKAMKKLLELGERIRLDFTEENITSEADRNAILCCVKKQLEYLYDNFEKKISNADDSILQDLTFDACYQGVFLNIEMLVSRFSGGSDFNQRVLFAKKQAIEQIATQYIRENKLCSHIGNEIHYISALYNYVASEYNLETKQDHFSHTHWEIETLNEFKKTIEKKLTLELVATNICFQIFVPEEASASSTNIINQYLPCDLSEEDRLLFSTGIYNTFDEKSSALKAENTERLTAMMVAYSLEASDFSKDSIQHTNISLSLSDFSTEDVKTLQNLLQRKQKNDIECNEGLYNKIRSLKMKENAHKSTSFTIEETHSIERLLDSNNQGFIITKALLQTHDDLFVISKHSIEDLSLTMDSIRTAKDDDIELIRYYLKDIIRMSPSGSLQHLSQETIQQLNVMNLGDSSIFVWSLLRKREKLNTKSKNLIANEFKKGVLNIDSIDFHGKKAIDLMVENSQIDLLCDLLLVLPKEAALTASKVMFNNGQTLVNFAVENNREKILDKLLEIGVDLSEIEINTLTPKALVCILDRLSDDNILKKITQKDMNGNNRLHLAASLNFDTLTLMLKKLPDNECFNALISRNNYGDTALHYIARTNPMELPNILETIPNHKKFDALTQRGRGRKTVIYSALGNNCKIFYEILKVIPSDHRFKLITHQINKDTTVLSKVINRHPEELLNILETLFSNRRFDLLMEKNTNNQTALDWIINNHPGLLVNILEKLPGDKILNILTHKRKSQTTVLNYLRKNNRFILGNIVLKLPANQILDIINIRDSYGNTVLHTVSMYQPEVVDNILEKIPSSRRFHVLSNQYNKNKNSVLHSVAIKKPEVLGSILKKLDNNKRFYVLFQKDDYGTSALHWAADKNPETLTNILETLPVNNRFDSLSQQDKIGDSVLHWAADKNPETLPAILETLPNNKRFDAVCQKDKKGDSTLHWVANNSPEALLAILETLPNNKYFDAVCQKDKNGDSVLHWAANNSPKVLPYILETLPDNKRLDAVCQKDKNGDSVLHWAANNSPKVLPYILETLPHNKRLDAVCQKDKNGDSVLHWVENKNPEELDSILESIPTRFKEISSDLLNITLEDRSVQSTFKEKNKNTKITEFFSNNYYKLFDINNNQNTFPYKIIPSLENNS